MRRRVLRKGPRRSGVIRFDCSLGAIKFDSKHNLAGARFFIFKIGAQGDYKLVH